MVRQCITVIVEDDGFPNAMNACNETPLKLKARLNGESLRGYRLSNVITAGARLTARDLLINPQTRLPRFKLNYALAIKQERYTTHDRNDNAMRYIRLCHWLRCADVSCAGNSIVDYT